MLSLLAIMERTLSTGIDEDVPEFGTQRWSKSLILVCAIFWYILGPSVSVYSVVQRVTNEPKQRNKHKLLCKRKKIPLIELEWLEESFS